MGEPARRSRLGEWIVGIVLIIILAALLLPGYLSSQRASNERGASASLKTLASAEADFRGHDRDKNGVQDFWTKDVAGLFDLVPPGDSEPIQLIGRGTAEADPTRPGATPWAGYWFSAMDKDEEGNDYRQGDRNPSKFAFRAYPVDRSTGRHAFYINEGDYIFTRSTESPLLTQWPSTAELQVWSRDHDCCK